MAENMPMKYFDPSLSTESVVKELERAFERELDAMASDVCQNRSLRILTLSGPSCSGKTTTANKLIDRFAAEGREIHVISLDDFYFDKSVLNARALSDDSVEIDYDSADTIDIELLDRCVSAIFSGRSAQFPLFDFKEGRRVGYRELQGVDEDDLFVFEGIQAIYPQITQILEQYTFKSLSIHTDSAISYEGTVFLPEEIRLYRRLVRDYNFRNATPEFTFYLWKSVRENEKNNIFPYMSACDYRIDATLAFELGLIKPYLEEVLARCEETAARENGVPEILEKLKNITPIPKAFIAADSLYNEFLK